MADWCAQVNSQSGRLRTWGQVLHSVTLQGSKTCDTDAGGCGRFCAVQSFVYVPAPWCFVVRLAWERVRETPEAIRGTLAAIQEVRLAARFHSNVVLVILRLRSCVRACALVVNMRTPGLGTLCAVAQGKKVAPLAAIQEASILLCLLFTGALWCLVSSGTFSASALICLRCCDAAQRSCCMMSYATSLMTL